MGEKEKDDDKVKEEKETEEKGKGCLVIAHYIFTKQLQYAN